MACQYKGGQRNYLAAQRRDVTSRGAPAEPRLGGASQPYGQCKEGITMKSRSIDHVKPTIRSISVMRFPRAVGFCPSPKRETVRKTH